MLTVANGDDDTLREGGLSCPTCQGTLHPWGHARLRFIRHRGGGTWVRPRRARCRACGRTQVLLPCRLLERRRDAASDIGVILEAYAGRTGYRRAARELDIPVPTVRNWIRGLRGRWSVISVRFDPAAAHPDDPGTAVGAVWGAAGRAGWSARPWEFASLATNGSLLATNGSLLVADGSVPVANTN
jgi:hypothetical protein